jgi:hypothetical protein
MIEAVARALHVEKRSGRARFGGDNRKSSKSSEKSKMGLYLSNHWTESSEN